MESKISFMLLPTEIIEKIAYFCDGKTLINLSKAVDKLNYLIDKPHRKIVGVWGKICKNEIYTDYIIDILQNLFPKYWFGDKVMPVQWHLLYKCWRQWRYIQGFLVRKLRLVLDYDVTKLSFSGNWLVIAADEILLAFDWEKNRARSKVLLYKSGPIQDIYLRCTVVGGTGGKILKGLEHDEAVLVAKRTNIIYNFYTGKTECYGKMKNKCQLKHFEGQQVSIESYPHRSTISCTDTRNSSSIQTETDGIWNVLQIWNEKILFLDERYSSCVTNYNLEPLVHPMNNMRIDREYLTQPLSQVWHMNVIIAVDITNSYQAHYIDVIVAGNKNRLYPFRDLNMHVTSVLYHAGVLMFGTDLGAIFVYRLNKDEDLLCLRLTTPCFRIEVAGEPILALAVQETSEFPVIAAAVQHHVYLVRCF